MSARAELTKLWTLPSARWLLGATVLALVVVGAAVASTIDSSPGLDPVRASLGGVWVAQVAVAVLGVLAMSTEYDPPQVRVTLAAVPRRIEVLAAKLGVLAGLVAAAAAVGTAGALVAGRLIPGGTGVSLTASATLRAAVGTVCYLALVAVLASGLAAVLRDGAGAVVSVLALLYLFPLLASVVSDPVWQHRLHRYAPMDAGLAVQTTRDLDHAAIGPWAGLAVLAGYALAGVAVGAAAFRYRDA